MPALMGSDQPIAPLPARRACAERGFTLLELMVALTVGAILFGVGIHSFKYVTTANRISGEINGLLGDLQFARAEAIKEGRTVTVCAVTNAANNTCSGAATWAQGWIVFSDPNNNKTVDAGEGLIRHQNGLGGTDTLTANNNITAVSFNREGFALGMAFNPAATFALKDATANAAKTRCIQINTVGQLVSERTGQGACP